MSKKYTILLILLLIIVTIVLGSFFSSKLVAHVLVSLKRMAIGYVLSVVVSFIVAILLGLNKYVRMMFKPILSFFMSIPTITWVPLLLITTGISEKTIIIAIFLGSFFAIVYNILDGFENVDKNLLRLSTLLEYDGYRKFTKVLIPASFNNILVGLKLGIAYSWRALVGAEMLAAASRGLGFLIFASRAFYNLSSMIFGLVLIGLFGYLFIKLMELYLERNTVDKWGFTK